VSSRFDGVEHELRVVAAVPRRRSWRPTSPRSVAMLIVGAALVIVGLALSRHRHGAESAQSPSRTQRDLSVEWRIGPTLRELMANFAVLRRPATATDRAAVASFVASTDRQPEIPEYVRLAGVVDGIHVYFVVYPVFRHGASGPVVAHQMNVLASAGMPYAN
jgi:hypothetical protein